MDMNRVMAFGFTVEEDRDAPAYLTVRVWVRGSITRSSETVEYRHLTLGEVCDVLLASVEEYRPGSDLRHGWLQPVLPWVD